MQSLILDPINSTLNNSQSIKVAVINQCGVFDDVKYAIFLKNKYRIFAQPIGTLSTKPSQSKVLAPPFIIDSYALTLGYFQKLFIISNETKEVVEQITFISQSIEFKIYKKIYEQGKFFILSGSKFGALFTVYEEDPEFQHAKYLVFHIKESNFHNPSLIEINRCATIVKKNCVLVTIQDNQSEQNKEIIKQQQLQFTTIQRIDLSDQDEGQH